MVPEQLNTGPSTKVFEDALVGDHVIVVHRCVPRRLLWISKIHSINILYASFKLQS